MSGSTTQVTAWVPKDFLAKIVDPAITALPLDVEEQGNKDGTRGPALGYFQMEPKTHDDIWANYLKYRKSVAAAVLTVAGLTSGQPKAALLKTNHVYAALMARVHYRRVKGKIPATDDVKTLAAYWKQHYNTPLGKGKTEEFEAKLNDARSKL